jgi:hypothetical protein
MYANIPTNELTPLITTLCNWYNIGKEIEQEIIKLMKIILKQNYFQFNDSIYTQTKGLTMGALTTLVHSEIRLKYLEHTTIFNILMQHKITEYYRYVDILLVYNIRQTDIDKVLNQFNKINKGIQFTLEQLQNNSIHFLDLTIARIDNNLQFKIY